MEQNYKLDLKDYKILAELDKNARQSNNQIGKKVGLSKEVVKYRIDKMIENKIIVRFHTVINYFKLGIVKFKLYLRFVNANKEKLEEIGDHFKEHKNTEWVALTTGRWDMILGFLVHNVNEFDEEIQKTLNKFSQYIQEKAVVMTLYLAHHEREFLRNDKNKILPSIVYHTTKDNIEKIDKIDEEILRIIANNARIPITEIAEKLKITPRIAQYKLKLLEKRKIILAYKINLNAKAMNRLVCKAIIYLSNITKSRLESFTNYVGSLKDAVWPQRFIGNWDFEIDFETKDYDSFQDILLDLKEKFPDVIKNYEFCILSKEFKLDLFPNAYPSF